MTPCIKCVVKGLVQGVFFRVSTQQQAKQLNITGHAINLQNGDVEVLACGKQEDIAKLSEWLKTGPADAKVTQLDCDNYSGDIPTNFQTGW